MNEYVRRQDRIADLEAEVARLRAKLERVEAIAEGGEEDGTWERFGEILAAIREDKGA